MGLLLFHAGSETRLRAVEIVNAVSLEFVNKLEIMKSPKAIKFLKAITIVKTIKVLSCRAPKNTLDWLSAAPPEKQGATE